jgi:DUF4097 and DUF4098 domain-containing protein YvlB
VHARGWGVRAQKPQGVGRVLTVQYLSLVWGWCARRRVAWLKYPVRDHSRMKESLSRRGLLAGGGAAVAAALAGCSGMTPFVGKREASTRTLPVEDATGLEAVVDVGDVTVSTADREDVHVEIVKQSSSVGADLSNLEFRVERPDDRLRLRGAWTGGGALAGTPSMNLDVTIPRSLAVARAETSTGDVDVRDAAGDLTVESNTGDLRVRDVDGDVRATSSTGDIELVGVSGLATADASTGDVTIRDVGVTGGVAANTGDLEVDVPAIDGDTTLQSHTGDVAAAIGEVDAELEARANVGDVSVSGLDLRDSTIDDDSATGTLGDGGPTLRVQANVGDVALEPLD